MGTCEGLVGIYEGSWHCDIHDEDYTSEGICPGCYSEMQYGDARMGDKPNE